nr:hypothetical protein [uncultured Brevundimonas sp.]
MRSLIRPLVLHVILQVRIAPPAAAARLIASSPRRHGARANAAGQPPEEGARASG